MVTLAIDLKVLAPYLGAALLVIVAFTSLVSFFVFRKVVRDLRALFSSWKANRASPVVAWDSHRLSSKPA